MSEIVHRCGHCNRTLHDINSMKMGYGPVCYKKLFGKSLPKEKKERSTSHKKTKRLIDLSEMYDLDEVFKDVC